MEKTMYYFANFIKLVGQFLSVILSIIYVLVLAIFSVVLILPSYFNESQVTVFLKNYTTNNIAEYLSAFAYNPDNIYTFIILIILILVLIALFLFRFRHTFIIAGLPALAFGLSLSNLNFFSGLITSKLGQKDLLVFEDIKTNLFNKAKNVGLFYMVFGAIILFFGIYLVVLNQKRIEKEEKAKEEEPKSISEITSEKIDFTPNNQEVKSENNEIKSNIFCPNCQNEYLVDAKFCTKCGQKRIL